VAADMPDDEIKCITGSTTCPFQSENTVWCRNKVEWLDCKVKSLEAWKALVLKNDVARGVFSYVDIVERLDKLEKHNHSICDEAPQVEENIDDTLDLEEKYKKLESALTEVISYLELKGMGSLDILPLKAKTDGTDYKAKWEHIVQYTKNFKASFPEYNPLEIWKASETENWSESTYVFHEFYKLIIGLPKEAAEDPKEQEPLNPKCIPCNHKEMCQFCDEFKKVPKEHEPKTDKKICPYFNKEREQS
jgi:hypothetical protein